MSICIFLQQAVQNLPPGLGMCFLDLRWIWLSILKYFLEPTGFVPPLLTWCPKGCIRYESSQPIKGEHANLGLGIREASLPSSGAWGRIYCLEGALGLWPDPWWLIFCYIDQMFDLIDRIVSRSQLSNSKLKPAVMWRLSTHKPRGHLDTGVPVPVCSHLLWYGYFHCASFLGTHFSLSWKRAVLCSDHNSQLSTTASWLEISSPPVVSWVTMSSLISWCCSFLVLKVEVTIVPDSRVDIRIK